VCVCVEQPFITILYATRNKQDLIILSLSSPNYSIRLTIQHYADMQNRSISFPNTKKSLCFLFEPILTERKKTAMYYGTYLFKDVKIYSNEYGEAFKILDYGLLN